MTPSWAHDLGWSWPNNVDRIFLQKGTPMTDDNRLPAGTAEATTLAGELTQQGVAFADFTLKVWNEKEQRFEEWYIRCDRYRVKPKGKPEAASEPRERAAKRVKASWATKPPAGT